MTLHRLAAGEIGEIGADAVRELSARSIGGDTIAVYADKTFDWRPIQDGGWDWIGVRAEDDGGGASLRDLVEVAQAWGEALVPLPLLETIWSKRWSSVARELDGPVTLSLPRNGSADDPTARGDGRSPVPSPRPREDGLAGVAPFGDGPTCIMATVGKPHDRVADLAVRLPEDFAPNLRVAGVASTTDVQAAAAHELAVLWAGECVGAARALLAMSVDYAKNRTQFGQPIGRFQVIKHRLADMHAQVELADTATVWASHEPSQARRASISAIDSGILVAQSAIQVHGGMGFTWEMGLHYYLRSMLVRRDLVSVLVP